MRRFIRLDENNKVIAVRYGSAIADGEIQSEEGDLGQIMLPDGTFIWPEPEPIEPMPTLEELIYAENLYQTALLELQMMGVE